MASSMIAVVEMGTSRMLGATGEYLQDGSVRLISLVSQPSSGLRGGVIIDRDNAVRSVQELLGKLQAKTKEALKAKVDIATVSLLCTSGEISCDTCTKIMPIASPDHYITEEDCALLIKQLNEVPVSPERQMIAKVRTNWFVDSVRCDKPANLKGGELMLQGLIVHTLSSRLNLFLDVLEEANVETDYERIYVPAMTAAQVGLDKEQQRIGTLLLDLGGDTTSWCVFHNGGIISVGSIPIGGDHITNDLMAGFCTGSTMSAENLKRMHGSAVLDGIDSSVRVKLPTELGGEARTASLRSVAMVVNARLEETLNIVRELLGEQVLACLGGGIVLSGNGSLLNGATRLVEQVFGKPCSLIRLETGFAEIDRNPTDTAALWGALVQTARYELHSELQRRERGLFKRLFGWMADFFFEQGGSEK